jgi:hypothetical protein
MDYTHNFEQPGECESGIEPPTPAFLTLASDPSKYLLRPQTIPYAARPQRRQLRLDAGSFPDC